eukprot:COSAG05_NODE_1775_length_4109_cov_2.715960_4_plen_342_part_00
MQTDRSSAGRAGGISDAAEGHYYQGFAAATDGGGDLDFQPLHRLQAAALLGQPGRYYRANTGVEAPAPTAEPTADGGILRRRTNDFSAVGGGAAPAGMGVTWQDTSTSQLPRSSGSMPEHRPSSSLLSEFRHEEQAAAAAAATNHGVRAPSHETVNDAPYTASSSFPPHELEWEERAVLVQASDSGGDGPSSPGKDEDAGASDGSGGGGLVRMNKYLRAGWRVKTSTPCRGAGICWLVIVHRPRPPPATITSLPYHNTGASYHDLAAGAADVAETAMATADGRGGSYTAAHLPKYLARPGITDSEQAARERRWAVPRSARGLRDESSSSRRADTGAFAYNR